MYGAVRERNVDWGSLVIDVVIETSKPHEGVVGIGVSKACKRKMRCERSCRKLSRWFERAMDRMVENHIEMR